MKNIQTAYTTTLTVKTNKNLKNTYESFIDATDVLILVYALSVNSLNTLCGVELLKFDYFCFKFLEKV